MATRDEIDDIVIRPMVETYAMPHGMNTSQAQRVKQMFYDALEPFPADALRKGWQKTTQTHPRWDWPTLAQIVSASRSFLA